MSTDTRRYCALTLEAVPAHIIETLFSAPLAMLLRDENEVTLIVAEEVLARYRDTLATGDTSPFYRLISLDAPLAFDVVGYLAAFAGVLGDTGASILAVSAFSRDHIFVREHDFERAWAALDAFVGACRADQPYVERSNV